MPSATATAAAGHRGGSSSGPAAGSRTPSTVSSRSPSPVRSGPAVPGPWTKTSVARFESFATSVLAALPKARKRPSADSAGLSLMLFPAAPPEPTLARAVSPVTRSWT